MEETICIYCRGDALEAKGEEHVAPECLGYKDTLPRGTVCDECNGYLSKLDSAALAHPRIGEAVMLSGVRGKTGKPRSGSQDGRMSIERRANGETVLSITLLDPKLHRPIRFTRAGERWKLPVVAAPPRDFTACKFSRSLHKMGLNAACFWKGHSFALQSECDEVRAFVRRPVSAREFRPYGQYGGSARPTAWAFSSYTRSGRSDVLWVLDIPIHGHAFAVALNGSHVDAADVLAAHARTRPEFDVLGSAKRAMATLPSRNPANYVETLPDDGKPDFLIEIAMMKVEGTFVQDVDNGESADPKTGS